MKFKKLTKITGLKSPQILVKDNILIATNGFVLAEVPFEQTGDKKRLSGSYKRAYFNEEINVIHDGEILYKNEILIEPPVQMDLSFPDYDDLFELENNTPSVKVDIKVLEKLLAVFKEQKDTKVEFHFRKAGKPMLIKGEKVSGIISPMTLEDEVGK